MSDYEAACERAATIQGLDPITAALRATGIPHSVDQTGGMTMLVRVPLVNGRWLGINAEGDYDREDESDNWYIRAYASDEDELGVLVVDGGTIADLLHAIAEDVLHRG